MDVTRIDLAIIYCILESMLSSGLLSDVGIIMVMYFYVTGKSLLWVGALLLAIVFIYAVAGYLFLRQEFDVAENVFCERLDDCFTSILRFGLIDNFLVCIIT